VEKVVIRKLRIEDADAVRRIQFEITKEEDDIDYQESLRAVASGNQHMGIAAEIDGKVVGYMIGYMLFSGFGLSKSAWITNFGVDPMYMGQGIGKSLAKRVLEEYEERGVTHIYTAVRWDSVDLLSFFRTIGFDRSTLINLCKIAEKR